MADLNIPQKYRKGRPAPPRLDLTPMVDLGFILITFFIYTTTLAKPNAIDVLMPSHDSVDKPTVFPEESTVTLLPRKSGLYYYYGSLQSKDQVKKAGLTEARNILLKKKSDAANLPASFSAAAHQLHVLLKPGNDCKYELVVQLLDEMEIVRVLVFTFGDISAQEEEWTDK